MNDIYHYTGVFVHKFWCPQITFHPNTLTLKNPAIDAELQSVLVNK